MATDTGAAAGTEESHTGEDLVPEPLELADAINCVSVLLEDEALGLPVPLRPASLCQEVDEL